VTDSKLTEKKVTTALLHTATQDSHRKYTEEYGQWRHGKGGRVNCSPVKFQPVEQFGRAAVDMGIPMGIPMGMGMVWVWGL